MSDAPLPTLRPITPEDEAFQYALYASTREAELARVAWAPGQKEAFLHQQFTAQSRHYREHFAAASFQVIEQAGAPVGRLIVFRGEAEIRIVDIALLPAARGRGLGGRLLRALLAEGAATNRPVRIHVERLNPALRLYERLGFQLLEDKGVYLFLEWRPSAAKEAVND